MKSSKVMFSTVVAVALLLLLAPASEAAITCSDVVKDLRPCVSYLMQGNGKPPAACCSGVQTLASTTTSSADKKTACNCIKTAAKNINVNTKTAQDLPRNCGITLSFSVSPSVDCSKIG